MRTLTYRFLPYLACIFACAYGPVAKASGNAASAPVDANEGGQPLWEAGVGGAGFDTPAYPAADQNTTHALALPFLLYRGKVMRVDQQGVGARLVNNDRVEFDLGFAASLPSRSSDVAARRGMPNLGTLVEFGPRVKVHLADLGEAGRLRFELPLRAVIEMRGGVRRQGTTLEPRIVWEKRAADGRWTIDGQLAADFGDRRVNRYFYEVAPQYATAERAAYRAEGGLLLLRTGLAGSLRINPDLRLFSFLRVESYGDGANRASPLFRKSVGVSAGVGFAWTLARSRARADE